MCKPTISKQASADMCNSMDHHNSARTRRRERRKKERANLEHEPPTQAKRESPSKQKRAGRKMNNHQSPRKNDCVRKECSSVSPCPSDASSSTSGSSTSNSSRPQHPQNEKRNRKDRSMKSKAKRKPMKKKNKVEIEIVPDEEKARFVGLDCEMVGVGLDGKRSALARVSIVNWEGDCLLDTFVRVAEHVTDYRTFVSGIREEDLTSDDAMDLDDCRREVCNIVAGKVVVGHALRNDFRALGITHPWFMVRDSARYEPFMKSDPTIPGKLIPKRLKDLARDKLGLIIQADGQEHDSLVDASAAMDLYKKARKKWELAVQWKIMKTKEIEQQQLQILQEIPPTGPAHVTCDWYVKNEAQLPCIA